MAVEIGGLALIGRHSQCCIALQQFNRAVSLARRKRHIFGGDVMLEIDERLASRLRDKPKGVMSTAHRLLPQPRAVESASPRVGGFCAGGGALPQRIRQRERAAAAPATRMPRRFSPATKAAMSRTRWAGPPSGLSVRARDSSRRTPRQVRIQPDDLPVALLRDVTLLTARPPWTSTTRAPRALASSVASLAR